MIKRDDVREETLRIGEDEIPVKVRKMPWRMKNRIVSQCSSVKQNPNGEPEMGFDGDAYIAKCLEYLIVEAPWGKTTETFLSQIDDRLGQALEQFVPAAFGSSTELKVEDTKKES